MAQRGISARMHAEPGAKKGMQVGYRSRRRQEVVRGGGACTLGPGFNGNGVGTTVRWEMRSKWRCLIDREGFQLEGHRRCNGRRGRKCKRVGGR